MLSYPHMCQTSHVNGTNLRLDNPQTQEAPSSAASHVATCNLWQLPNSKPPVDGSNVTLPPATGVLFESPSGGFGGQSPSKLRPDPTRQYELDPTLTALADAATLEWQPLTPRDEPIFEALNVILESRGTTSQKPFEVSEPAPAPTNTSQSPGTLTPQQEFWRERLHWKASTAAKLRSISAHQEADKLDHCRSEESVKRCLGCSKVTHYWNRCDLFYCPACAPKLSMEKRKSVEAWTKYIGQPKHVVLTVKNMANLTKADVQWFKQCWSKLRRTVFANANSNVPYACEIPSRKILERYSKPWRGGFYSLEVTKEANGWHLHLHALVDCNFIDTFLLADAWYKATGGRGYIVQVKDARDKSYLQEVMKYVVKGDQIASWPAADILTFIRAFEGVRTFGVFGSLYAQRSEFRAMLDAMQCQSGHCQCGSDRFEILSIKEWEWRETTSGGAPPSSARPQTCKAPAQTEFLAPSKVLAAFAR